MIPRYSRPEMTKIWDPENRFRIWFEIEAHACDALAELGVINANLMKVVGFTATPYRLDSGMLHKGKDRLFTDIAFEVSVLDMIKQGYLCPVIPKQTHTQLDTSGVGTRGGRQGRARPAVPKD